MEYKVFYNEIVRKVAFIDATSEEEAELKFCKGQIKDIYTCDDKDTEIRGISNILPTMPVKIK